MPKQTSRRSRKTKKIKKYWQENDDQRGRHELRAGATHQETIEHIDPGHLPRVERAVFATMHPGLVLLTTPNQEGNVLHGMQPGHKRHPGHHFEWTRAQFQHWAGGVAQRHGYSVSFSDLGTPDPGRGSSSQMARFVLTGAQ